MGWKGEPSEMLDALREPCDVSSMIMKYTEEMAM